MQKARTCGGIPLVASHWFRPISRIPLIVFHRLRSSGSFQRLTPKAHSKGSSRTAHLIVSRVAFHEAYKLPHSDIMPIHGNHQTWPPTPKKSTFRAAIEQTYAHNGRVNNLRFFLAGSTAISLQGQGTIPYCRTNSCALRAIQSTPSAGFFYWQLACNAPHLLHFFECSIRVIYCIFLEPLRMNRPRTNAPEAIESHVIPLPNECGKSFSGLADMRATIAIPTSASAGNFTVLHDIASPPAIIVLYTLLAFSYTRAKTPCPKPDALPSPFSLPFPFLPNAFPYGHLAHQENLLLDAFDPFI
mgnify:CR=1 FL=1